MSDWEISGEADKVSHARSQAFNIENHINCP